MKPKKRNKLRKNPFELAKLSEKDLSKLLTDQIIMQNFGLLGLALSDGSEKFKKALLQVSGVIVDGSDKKST